MTERIRATVESVTHHSHDFSEVRIESIGLGEGTFPGRPGVGLLFRTKDPSFAAMFTAGAPVELSVKRLEVFHTAEIEIGVDSPEERQPVELLKEIRHGLHQLREEIRIMGETQQDQATQLSSDVTALMIAFTGFEAAVAAEIAAAKSSPAAADPVVAQALTNIEALTAKIVADTAAAQPAPAAAAPAAGDGGIPTITG